MPGKINKNELFVKIARETGLSKAEIKKAIMEQFKFVSKTMANDNFEQIRLPYFGRFWAKESRIAHLNKKYGKTRGKIEVGPTGKNSS